MKIDSPCKLVCLYDKNKTCVGCYRTMEEITQWESYNDIEKMTVWKKIRQRKRAASN